MSYCRSSSNRIHSLVAQSSSNHLTDSIGPKVDDLWKMLRRTTLTERIENGTPLPGFGDPKDMELSRHSKELRVSTMEVLSRTSTGNILLEYEENPKLPPETTFSSEKSDDDSDDELEVEISLGLLAKGVELCNQQKYGEAGATLQNSLQAIQRMNLQVTSVEAIKEAQLKLAIVYLYQEKWSQAEEILLYLSADSTMSNVEKICRLDALYYLSQIHLARHMFDLALDSCKEAISGRRKLLTKTHPSYYQSVVLLVLIYETSNDRTAAAMYAKTIPTDCLSDKRTIAVLRFSSKGFNLSIEGELAAVKKLSEVPYGSDFPSRYTDLGLMWAAGEGYKDVAQLLLWRGVNVDTYSVDKVTPLMCAAGAGHKDVVQLLLDKGADVNRAATRTGDSALRRAAWNGHESVVSLLLGQGAKIEGSVESGWSTLMGAALNGHDGTLELLLEKGADVNVMNRSYKRTALMYAAREGQESTVALLLQAGANVNARDQCGDTALEFAKEDTRIPQILKGAGATGREDVKCESSMSISYHVGKGCE